MKKLLFVLSFLLIPQVCAPVARAADGQWADPDRETIARIADYLNRMTTLKSRFIQMTSTGNYAEGTVYFSRPGKLRFEYDPPIPYMLVSNGDSVAYYDFELENVSYADLESTPAGFLVGETIDLETRAQVTSVGHYQGTLQISLVDPKDPDKGTFTVVFSEKPLTLRQWSVVDIQGIETTVTLLSPKFGQAVDAELFKLRSLGAMRPKKK